MSQAKDHLITLEGLEYYDEHAFPLRVQSSMLTFGTAIMNLVNRVDEIESNGGGGGLTEFAIPINPTTTPVTNGAVWFETEGGV